MGKKSLTLEAVVVPEICSIQNAHVELARKEYPHLKGIWFSDVCKEEEELEIDILIGSDYLWSFQTGSTRRGKTGDPVAVQTELRWALHGQKYHRPVASCGFYQADANCQQVATGLLVFSGRNRLAETGLSQAVNDRVVAACWNKTLQICY